MTPVSLKLRNFLSYGTAAEALDFDAFHVACLSGRNGQGKSALLDAITWAVWGEARKSSDARKPDEELLRIGTRDMEVELVFELEGQRYRVVRSFYVTQSGKSRKPGLEFQAWDAAADAFRPLTKGSVAETQRAIDDALGLDYDTFINSAFLLQGRSDEFTKKKPTERKAILGRILNLGRYDRLAQAARERWSAAGERVREHEAEMDRLKEELEEEGRWQEELAAVEAAIAERAEEKERVEAAEAGLTEELAALDALAQQADAHRDRLGHLAERGEKLAEEQEALAERIEQAERLIARADAIRRDHARYDALRTEDADWHQKAELHRGIETQLHERRMTLERQQMEAEARLSKLDAQLRADRRSAEEAERRLLEQPRAEAGLEKAEAAQAEYEALRQRREERQRVEQRVQQLRAQLGAERGTLNGQLGQLKLQVRQSEEAAERLPALRAEVVALRERVGAVRAVEAERDAVREMGSEVGAAVAGFERDVERLRSECVALAERARRLAAVETEACPTCGTPLTDAHREQVAETYREEQDALAARLAEAEAACRERAEERDQLRARYRALQEQLARANGVAEGLARAEAEVERLESSQAEVARLREQARALHRQLTDETFRPDLRAELSSLDRRLDAEPFDEAAFERVRDEAAQRKRWEEKLRDLDAERGRLDELRARLDRQEREAEGLRADLAAGATAGPIRQQVGRLEAQLRQVGYDGARHDAVRRELDGLKEAPERYMQLATAERDLTDWAARRARLADEAEGVRAQQAEVRAALAAAEERLGARAALRAQQAEHARARAAVEAALSEAVARRGGLRERLDRCARDRARLAAVRKEHKAAKEERTLYRHLKDAFGKNGIPALIIEETLPEVEDRANRLLDRLSGGKTRVHLETLKDKKAGGTKETLDIRITDEGGVARAYETFSGGEAFRVNFALRIALAQLLAERAGVRIRTLVVDEGFGTQDKEGVESLVGAIQSVREDFDKVIVITHLDALKEAFPVRIEVEKHPVEGSRYEVLGV